MTIVKSGRTVGYTYSSKAHMEYTLRQSIFWIIKHLNRYKRIEITQYILSDHNGIKPEISNRKRIGKSQNVLGLNSTLLNSEWGKRSLKQKF